MADFTTSSASPERASQRFRCVTHDRRGHGRRGQGRAGLVRPALHVAGRRQPGDVPIEVFDGIRAGSVAWTVSSRVGEDRPQPVIRFDALSHATPLFRKCDSFAMWQASAA